MKTKQLLSAILIGSVLLSVPAGAGTNPTQNAVKYYQQLLVRCDDSNERLLSDIRNLTMINLQKDKENAILKAKDDHYLFMPVSFWGGICTGFCAALILGALK